MKEVPNFFKKYRGVLFPPDIEALKELGNRAYKAYINPPKERGVYLKPEQLPELSKKVASIKTSAEPKQVVYDKNKGKAYVSCMKGKNLDIFSISNNSIAFEKSINFKDQCVEITLEENLLFLTTSNFMRPPSETRDKLWILDTSNMEVVSSIKNAGEWNKVIAPNTSYKEVLVTNWHTHNITVFDINDINKPRIKDVISWGKSPRGISLYNQGKSALVSGFYSGNIGVLERRNNKWVVEYTSPTFDAPNYHGNMRDIVISPDEKTAIITNLGRNSIHFWSIYDRKITYSISVGKSPNSVRLLDKNLAAVSCRESGSIYFVDINSKKVLGRSPFTKEKPTGLAHFDGKLLLTSFKDGCLELFKYT